MSPHPYERVRLGDILRLRKEIVHPFNRPTGRLKFVGLEHLESGTGRRVGELDVDLTTLTGRKPRFYQNDVVYGYLRPYLNKVWVAEFDGICSVDQYVYSVDSTRALPAFVASFMRSPAYLNQAPVKAGPGQLPRIRTDEVAEVVITLPPLSVQSERLGVITEQLARAQQALAAAEAQRTAIEDASRALRREVFMDIMPLAAGSPTVAPPPGWRWRRLTDLARLESGHTPSRYHREYWGGAIPWIALPDIRALDAKVATETTEYTNDLGIANSAARVLPPGTVVVSRTASVGFVTIMGREMATSQDFVNWVCGPDLDPRFLLHVFLTARTHFRNLASGAVHKTVYMPTVMSLHVCIPEVQQQRRLAWLLDDWQDWQERSLRANREMREAVDSLPAALLRRAFNGGFSREALKARRGEGEP